jgi:hypothetical protein
MVGGPRSKWLKVAALNLWEASRYFLTGRFPASRPTSQAASPLLPKAAFSYCDTALKGKGQGEGDSREDGHEPRARTRYFQGETYGS